MEYSRRTVNKDSERDLVIGLITSDEFIKAVRPVLKKEHMTLPYSKFVLDWAYDYFDKYSKAPDKDIVLIFEENKPKIRDEATIESLEVFIDKLSERFENSESFNAAYQIDKAIDFAKNSSINILIDRLKIAQLSGDVSKAEAEISNFKRVEKGCGSTLNVWSDQEAVIDAIRENEEKDILVRFPGALGEVIRPLTSEDFFCAIAAPKKGKSWLLTEIAILGSLNRKNVLFVTLEMTAKQLMSRMYQRVTSTVSDNYGNSDGKEVDIPYFDAAYESNKRIYKKKEYYDALSTRAAVRKMKSIKGFVKSDTLKILEAPSGSLTIEQLESHLDNLEHFENWVPQIIVIDYIDIMAVSKKSDHRNEINFRWLEARGMGQKRKVLIASVSHTGRQTLTRDARVEDTTEDIRKINHASLVVAINQNDDDKSNGVQRFSVLADRFRAFNPAKEAVVTQSFEIGASYLDSRIIFKHKTEKSD